MYWGCIMDNLDIIIHNVEKQNNRLEKIVLVLKLYNIPVVKYEEGDMSVDPAIYLENDCHIQVELNGNYSLYKLLKDGCIMSYPSIKFLPKVVEDYKNAMGELK